MAGEEPDDAGTSCIEAFCAFDTGHDLSPRFWHASDTPFENDEARCDPSSPILPFLTPDLTANVICRRRYLAKIAVELGKSGTEWEEKAEAGPAGLFEHCFDAEDGFSYDRGKNDQLVRVQSDVLLRVLACEIGGRDNLAALARYLLCMHKLYAKYPFTSIAMDDPRFHQEYEQNSWAGPTNSLSLVRTPHAFDHHERQVELTWVICPILSSLLTQMGIHLS